MKPHRLLVSVGLLLVFALAAHPAFANGPQPFDPTFETGDLDGWTVLDAVDYVGVTGADQFTAPYGGDYMAVLGTPGTFHGQPPGPNWIGQTFAAADSVRFFLNFFTYDYYGWDYWEWDLVVEQGGYIDGDDGGAWGDQNDTSLKSTGWMEFTVDTSAYAGQYLSLYVGCGGTEDDSLGSWCYLDGPSAPRAPQLKLYFPQDHELLISYAGQDGIIARVQIIPGDEYALANLSPGSYDFALAPKDASAPPVFQGTVTLLPGRGEATLWFPLHNAAPTVFGWGYVSGAPQ